MFGHHPYMKQWRGVLKPHEAEHFGLLGLVRGLETYDSAKGDLMQHLKARIASSIGHEVSRIRKLGKKETSFDEPSGEGSYTLHDRISQAAPDYGELENNIALLLRSGRIRQHHLAIYVLSQVYGHSTTELGKHFGVVHQSVSRTCRVAKRVLAEIKREQH